MKPKNTASGSTTGLQLTEEQLKNIEEFAGVCFTPEEIAIIIGIDWETVKKEFKNKKSEIYLRYKKGELMSMFAVRKSIYELAKGGSSASQSEFLKLRKDVDSFFIKNNLV